MKKGKKRLYLWLLGIHMFISAFTFGGGYVVVPMIRKYFVLQKKMFGEGELAEMAAVSQSAPGAIAVNLAAVTGFRVAGASGAIISAFASVFPPFLIMGVISHSYQAFIANHAMAAVLKGMQAGAAVLIAETAFGMCRNIWKEHNFLFSLMIPVIFIFCFLGKGSAALALVTGCIMSLAQAWYLCGRRVKKTEKESEEV